MWESLLTGKVVDTTTLHFINIAVEKAYFLALAFIPLTLGYSYIKESLLSFASGKEGRTFDLFEVSRVIGIMFLIAIYATTVSPVMDSIQSLNESFKPNTASYDNARVEAESQMEIIQKSRTKTAYQQFQSLPKEEQKMFYESLSENDQNSLSGKLSTEEQATVHEEIGYLEGAYNYVADGIYSMVSKVTSVVPMILGLIAQLLSEGVKIFVYIGAFFVVKVLLIVGPLSLVFSILPVFKDQYVSWLGFTLNTAFVFLTLNIIDALVIQNGRGITEALNQMSDIELTGSKMAFDFVILALYLSAFKLTSVFVGKGFAGSIAQKAAGAAVMVAGALAAAGVGAGLANAGGGSGSGSSLGADAMKDMGKTAGRTMTDTE